LAVSLVLSLFLTPLTIALFKKKGWVVDPNKTPHPAHIHKEPVPKGGGLPIFLAVGITALIFLNWDKHLTAVLFASLLIIAIGIIDDVRGVNPYLRLSVNFLAAAVIVSAGIGIAFVSSPLGGVIDLSQVRYGFYIFGVYKEIWILADLFALLWIPLLMNAINWSSGVDGQISGVVTIAALVLGLISLSFSADITQWPVAILAFATAGAFLGLTVFHFYPQKIMPGYSATSLAGLLLGVISILATAKVGALLVVLGVPFIDFAFIFARRILSGKSPVWGDKSHLHHRLLELGWSKRKVALFYWLMAGGLGIVALNFRSNVKFYIIIGLALLMGLFLIWQYLARLSALPGRRNG